MWLAMFTKAPAAAWQGPAVAFVERLLNCLFSMGYVTDARIQMVVPIVQA